MFVEVKLSSNLPAKQNKSKYRYGTEKGNSGREGNDSVQDRSIRRAWLTR